jgi:chemotaxis response regulator CheB
MSAEKLIIMCTFTGDTAAIKDIMKDLPPDCPGIRKEIWLAH